MYSILHRLRRITNAAKISEGQNKRKKKCILFLPRASTHPFHFKFTIFIGGEAKFV